MVDTYLTTYCPDNKTISANGLSDTLYCGDDFLHPLARLMFAVKHNQLTLQEGFDSYLYLKEHGEV